MDLYLVGGAVRDQLLKKTVEEKDFVVTGESPESMIAKGFKQVGKDFPVFLHPKTHEEYALARRERKTDIGYHGFEMETDSNITLEEDLMRRDLTINAMAMDSFGHITDPYNGQTDLNNALLRHVSDAFIEDPLRVLRVARFQAYLPHFTIHPDTFLLMQDICKSPGEIASLPCERIWLEIHKAAKHPDFHLFWSVLQKCGALAALNITLSPVFTEDLKSSSLSGISRLISTLWHQKDVEGLMNTSPPTLINDALRIIHSQHDTLIAASSADDLAILQTSLRLDPFRRYDRARQIILSMPPQYTHQQSFWLKLCKALHHLDIKSVIAGSNPGDRQKLVEQERLSIIGNIKGS